MVIPKDGRESKNNGQCSDGSSNSSDGDERYSFFVIRTGWVHLPLAVVKLRFFSLRNDDTVMMRCCLSPEW